MESKTMRAGKRIKDVTETSSNNRIGFRWLEQSILPKCKNPKDENHFVSIKNLKGYKKSMMNKIRKFFKMDLLKELYIFEDGKQYLTSTGMEISESLFNETIEFILNKNLKDIEFWKTISSLREQSKWQLQEVLNQNVSKGTKKSHL